MSPIRSSGPARRGARRALLAVLCCTAIAAALQGCVYRINIQQGNYLDDETIALIEPGMTKSQVRFLLGTPMLEDSFHRNRWDYVYYFRQGRSRKADSRRFVVFFENDVVARTQADLEPQ